MPNILQLPQASFPLNVNHLLLTPLDLSITNTEIASLQSAASFEIYINQLLKQNQATVAYGGYLEQRNLYKRSSIFNNTQTDERNIHLGVDFWCDANTAVLAAFNGSVHSFANNLGLGNYGPTIILQHHIDGFIFHTLYGHLSNESLTNITIGQKVQAGQTIGSLGNSTVNGNYSPHLHFQLIIDLQSNIGDYPGVCAIKDLEFYKANCPNPALVLKEIR
jgi:murein DD-endopeptidase MepM/ murein hydrolase activator NlpD